MCEDSIDVYWSTKNRKHISACLYKGEDKAPLVCWEKHRSGRYKVTIQAFESLEFSLRQSLDNSVLAERKFEVVHDTKRYRRSRRNPWSFF